MDMTLVVFDFDYLHGTPADVVSACVSVRYVCTSGSIAAVPILRSCR